MPGEEECILDAYRQILPKHPNLRLMIAPRHPNRFDAVAGVIQAKGWDVLRRSELLKSKAASASGNAGVLLLDSIGELSSVFEHASVVYMGGSLVPTGGHNILEPARYGKPVVFGPHMENFRDIARVFVGAGAAIQILNAAGLGPAISRVLSDANAAREMGRSALAIVEQNTGATERILQFLEPAGARQ
jgi:3-deoxy-D-manno-octulosonic-acid transferase